MSTPEDTLSWWEIELLRRKAIGATNEGIAYSFGISPHHISVMWTNICAILGVYTKPGAVCEAIVLGIIEGPEPRLPLSPLSPAEKQTLPYIVADMTAGEIAEALGISRHNLYVRTSRIADHFEAESREHLAAILTKNYISQP